MPIGFSQPLNLLLLLLAVPVAWSAAHYLQPLSTGRRRAAMAVRLLAMLLVILALAGAQAVRRHHDLSVVAVVDESESMLRFAPRETLDVNDPQKPVNLQDWTRQWLRMASVDRKADDRLGLVTYDNRPTVVAMPGPTDSIDTGIVTQPRQGSRGGAAVRLAMAMLPPDTARRLVLVSDGNDTSEVDLLAAARQAAGAGVPIDVLPIDYALSREVMVEGLYTPSQARQGQTAAIRVVLHATTPTAGQLFLLRNGLPIDLNGKAQGQGAAIATDQWIVSHITSNTSNSSSSDTQSSQSQTQSPAAAGQYTLVKLIELPLSDAGANRFEAIFEPDEGSDAVATNNKATAFTLVRGQGKVLILSQEPKAETQRLVSALEEHGIQTQTGPGNGLPVDLAELSRYDTVILQNVPAEQMDESQQALLSQYVSDTGGGLVVMGGPDAFGAGGWTNSPLSKIFPVDCQLPAQFILPTGALVIVIDRSGSMREPVGGTPLTQQEVAAEAAVMAIATLYPRDLVGVVSFDSGARWDVPLAFNPDRRDVMSKIRAIQSEGGTNIFSGLEEAYSALADVETDTAAVKHIILLTDGQSGGGNYADLLERMKKRNISLSTIGVGNGVDGQLLTMLAKQGRGKYYPIINPRQLPQVFIKEARTIRKNLIREIPFLPKLVLSGSPVLAGLTRTPPLEGFVRTAPRKDPRVFLAMVGPEDEPILAHWQVGLGQVAAFTSDATSRWGQRWVDWDGYGDFWSRMVRSIGRPGSSRDLELTTRFADDELVLTVDAAHAGTSGSAQDATSFSQLKSVQAAVVGPDGRRQLVTLGQTGPGQYEAKLPAATSGSYLVSVLGEDREGKRQFVAGGANRPPGLELRRFASNRALLEEVAHLTGGRVLDANSAQVTGLFARDGKIEASRSIRPLWRLLIWLLLPLFLIDVAVRRLSWDPSAIRAWLGIREGGRTRGGDAQATLATLRQKGKRTATQGSDSQQPVAQPMAQASSASSTTSIESAQARGSQSAAAKLDQAAAQTKASGKGKADDAARAAGQSKEQGKGKDDGEPSTGTSRLMDAKRRARQKLDES